MPGWTNLYNLITEELIQMSQEGYDVSDFRESFNEQSNKEELLDIYNKLQSLTPNTDFPYIEPSDLESIRKESTGSEKKSVKIDDEYKNKVKGAWLGRIAGCMLGKNVEGWTKNEIREYLMAISEYPLTNYIPYKEISGLNKLPQKASSRGMWQNALIDDDTNYTVLALKLMENKGPDFTTMDVGNAWLENLPYMAVCTAERQAYMNLINELPIEEVNLYLNPYREWIGAQIRADFWGYVCPGDPERASEFAYRDAKLSHVKNGIYGEMFCAAAISAALVEDNLENIIKTGLSVIPAKSRLAETVNDCIRWKDECSDWESAFDKMMNTYYGKYNWVHTNNNLAVVLLALIYGFPDFEKVLCYSVMMGLDTDCNGATCGSIIGGFLGADALPDKWIKPLGGCLETSLTGFQKPNIDELAERTFQQALRINNQS
ncbi:MAG: ADP-ribosylglycohydrolase family protein [Armatimonadota bacterium]